MNPAFPRDIGRPVKCESFILISTESEYDTCKIAVDASA